MSTSDPRDSKAASVQPRLYKGLRDYLPDEMGARQRLIDTVRGVYEMYGFVPLGTPAIEHMDVLVGTGGQEANKSIFSVQGPDEDQLGLRFDQTVPLARVVAQYPQLPKPFRRYQVSPVWRADKPDKGRFREFVQFDIDSVGADSELADVEIIAAGCDAMDALGVKGFQMRFSSRKVLNLLLAYAQVPETLRVSVTTRGIASVEERPASDVFRVLDKLDKIGIEKVRAELGPGYTDESGDRIAGLGLERSQIDRIEAFLRIKGETRREILDALATTFAGVPNAEAEIGALRRMSDRLAMLGYADERVMVDLSIARGLAYYTGPVFEGRLTNAPEFGSVMAGGRYDDLVKRFLGESLPATGASIGVDRLLAALVHLGSIKLRSATAKVLIAAFDANLQEEYLRMAFELRRAGVPTELYLTSKGIGKQLKHADQQGIPLVVLCGSNEHAKGVVTIKEMESGRQLAAGAGDRAEWLKQRAGQAEVPRDQLVPTAKRLLDELGQSA
ncbi:MAG: histidine--tRNA ligase [Planctomycetota bacterium]|nr:histidine--tRNA ligase [Planctomycetota bacterium]